MLITVLIMQCLEELLEGKIAQLDLISKTKKNEFFLSFARGREPPDAMSLYSCRNEPPLYRQHSFLNSTWFLRSKEMFAFFSSKYKKGLSKISSLDQLL